MTSHASVSSDERLRLFLALRLPDDVLDEIERWQRAQLPRVRVVPRPHLHVTLAFLGHRPSGELEAIAGALRDAAVGAGKIRLTPVRYRERFATARPGASECSSSRMRKVARPSSPATSRNGWRGSGSTAVRAVPGCRISRSRDGANARGCGPTRRRGERSFRPTRLLTCHNCTPVGRGTKSWNLSL